MKSTTSCFDPTLYRKTMKRFWPLWAAYSLVLAFMLPLHLLNLSVRYSSAAPVDAATMMADRLMDIPRLLPIMLVILVVGAVLCAMAVFGYLYNHRSVCMIHSLPLRRETIFFTQYLAGLSFMLLPLLAVTAVTAVIEVIVAPAGVLVPALKGLLTWAWCSAAMSLFFFSFASFCAMFTGHILALPAFYGILNALAAALWALVSSLMELYFFGYEVNASPRAVEWLTPVWNLMSAVNWTPELDKEFRVVGGQLADPSVPVIYALAGVVLAVLALAVYRRRHLETAGDVVSVPMVRPVFRLGVAVCAGLFFGVFTTVFFNWEHSALLMALSVMVWAVVGCFAAEMLLQKSFRVFHKWKTAAAVAAVMALLCCSFQFDLFGVEDRVPAPDQVDSLILSIRLGYPNDDGYSADAELLSKDDPELIERMIGLHQLLVDEHSRLGDKMTEPDEIYSDTGWVTLTYTLKNGRTLSRNYHSLPLLQRDLDDPDTLTGRFQQLANDRELTAEAAYHFDRFEKEGVLTQVALNGCIDPVTYNFHDVLLEDLTGSQRTQLWQAVRQDFEEGNIGFRTVLLTPEFMDRIFSTHITFYWTRPQSIANLDSPTGSAQAWLSDTAEPLTYDQSLDLVLTRDAVHTLELLERFGAFTNGLTLSQRDYMVEDGQVFETGDSPADFAVG